jgi:hypothetical protein
MDSLSLARRDAVTRLCQAQVDGLISVEGFEERYAMIQQATSRGALDALVADLTVDDTTPLPLGGRAVERVTAVEEEANLPAIAGPVRIPAIVGSATRAGQWLVPDHLEILVLMGEMVLDFREALFQSDTVVVDLSVTVGSCQVIVPPGTQVVNECRELFGSSSHPRPKGRPAEPNGITIVLQGRILLAELKIRELQIGGRPGLAARMGLGNFN